MGLISRGQPCSQVRLGEPPLVLTERGENKVGWEGVEEDEKQSATILLG